MVMGKWVFVRSSIFPLVLLINGPIVCAFPLSTFCLLLTMAASFVSYLKTLQQLCHEAHRERMHALWWRAFAAAQTKKRTWRVDWHRTPTGMSAGMLLTDEECPFDKSRYVSATTWNTARCALQEVSGMDPYLVDLCMHHVGVPCELHLYRWIAWTIPGLQQ